ncbi:MAG: Pantothenate synthetase [Hydrocarboniphaga sp.]|uniref:pantoate--beta-alanine ligase n=1 Tax=Hydrocarboniphaga sp. TaxID=2033016 RepID=UPI0026195A8B|nr:pantoate--beta-alanine ligase [Hydrocarboniphaga sp.]MDB5968904.1 Pantothenate synthetase [Hydrocarboniphaga sp.]
MRLVHTVAEVRREIAAWRANGESVGFVATMGNLHAGHLDLVAEAKAKTDRVVASIFVNPLQFGPNEDFDRYPRTLPDDCARLDPAGCDLVFAPSVDEMYPRGRSNIAQVSVPGISGLLEGEFRPGFFEGVATVVSILFHIVQPDFAMFGRKDYQQFMVIRRMVAELHMPLQVVGVATRREPDGLAMSSRNQYLNQSERPVAPGLFRALSAVAQRLRTGSRDFQALEDEAKKLLEHQGFKPQYLAIRDPDDLGAPRAGGRGWVLLVAAHLGRTRLIDNLEVAA